jgi:hypothetical protein
MYNVTQPHRILLILKSAGVFRSHSWSGYCAKHGWFLNACSQRPLTIRFTETNFPLAPFSFNLAQYDLRSLEALKTKLGQFPHGTMFVWSPSEFAQSERVEDLFKELSEYATQHGMRLQGTPASTQNVK